jgi:predicted alpha/beta-hydrolase family hydrolase
LLQALARPAFGDSDRGTSLLRLPTAPGWLREDATLVFFVGLAGVLRETAPMTSRSARLVLGPDHSVGLLWSGPPRARVAILLAHGAGADMRSDFMEAYAEGLGALGHAVLRFNFPYKEAGKKLPDRPPLLERTLRAAAAHLRAEVPGARVVLGGKSMGGRYASLVAAKGEPVDGLLFFGYPLHPAGKDGPLRAAHLAQIAKPMLFVQGSRDALCQLDLLRPALAPLGERARLHVIEGGDHSFALPKSARRGPDVVRGEILGVVERWLAEIV